MDIKNAPQWDVFISHAYEDKDAVVRPLAMRLTSYGLRVWYDEFSLRLGDPLRVSLEKGLAESRFGVVVLSRSFFEKKWTSFEVDCLIQRDSPGMKLILPLWLGVDVSEVRSFSAALANKFAIRIDAGANSIEKAAISILEQVRPELHGRITRRRALIAALSTLPLRPMGLDDLGTVVLEKSEVYQEELGANFLMRIRLVRAALADVHTAEMADWIYDFQREPYPEREMFVWEYIAAIHMELSRKFSLRIEHRQAAHAIVLETTMLTEDLTERHASLWRMLRKDVRAYLVERMHSPLPYGDAVKPGPSPLGSRVRPALTERE